MAMEHLAPVMPATPPSHGICTEETDQISQMDNKLLVTLPVRKMVLVGTKFHVVSNTLCAYEQQYSDSESAFLQCNAACSCVVWQYHKQQDKFWTTHKTRMLSRW